MIYLKKVDPQIKALIQKEKKRQSETLMMIPSENMVSKAVEEAVGSCLGNKYAEGYPGKRYYQGQEYIDKIETLVVERVKKAFKVPYANVQPLSGSPANLAVYTALLKPNDKIMGLELAHGGHLTHGDKVSVSGQFFKSVSYKLGKDGFLDYQALEKLVLKEKPKLIIAGITAYPKILDWKKFSLIAKKVKAYLLADIAHLAGLVLGGVYPSPVSFVDVITTTTHKTLRGPRGAIIMVTRKGLKKDPDLDKKIQKAVFPGLQGGPHINSIAGIGVALKEAEKNSFKKYSKQIVLNAKALAKELKKNGFNLISGGTDSHLILIDLSSFKITGNLAAEALEAGGIVLNRNSIPYDSRPPFYPSGIRLGTPGITSREMKEPQMKKIALWMKIIIEEISEIKKKMKISFESEKKKETREKIIKQSKAIKSIIVEVKKLCQKYPIKDFY
ncbi:serine hydroxymethyltransferase [Candidatus Beckwithbacteria bacterium CG10_big_fil_rev_8_21_14_0_10_34_10]|uniref:Serine hydroxymethyltransferase n=1 Tax=Candidatus Beckwithbacteria bacterium CG10_big_fil_rev_8_21_14_0_10_34_10 TaxID=1974495 RepID=A0A2H0W7X2_9BACT|nr:MAG: serine hydroxymethyltransferase [Candidatus Beckwithbacteria bacterium CG10_big_fil_rev_8_21_14_0_10_34_10]